MNSSGESVQRARISIVTVVVAAPESCDQLIFYKENPTKERLEEKVFKIHLCYLNKFIIILAYHHTMSNSKRRVVVLRYKKEIEMYSHKRILFPCHVAVKKEHKVDIIKITYKLMFNFQFKSSILNSNEEIINSNVRCDFPLAISPHPWLLGSQTQQQ